MKIKFSLIFTGWDVYLDGYWTNNWFVPISFNKSYIDDT